jgi:hypothetical protein
MRNLPNYGLRAYALLYSRHGAKEPFGQQELGWFVSLPMRKKIFSVLLGAGWLKKQGRRQYVCISPEEAVRGVLEFRVPGILRAAGMDYALAGLSAVEAWSDYSYVQRGFERSPYFLKVPRKDLKKWQAFLNREGVPNYVGSGSTIGEFVVLVPVGKLEFVVKDGLKVELLRETMREAEKNYLYDYAVEYMRRKYGAGG